MRPADVKVGAIYQAVDFGSLEFDRGGSTEHCTYTPGSVVKVVGLGPIASHVATELLMGAVTHTGMSRSCTVTVSRCFVVYAEELEPLDPSLAPTNTPVCDAVTKEPAHDP